MRSCHLWKRTFVLLLVAGMAGVAATAIAATPPVSVAVAVTGDPVPGATVTAKATVTINDGSTLQTIKWTQVGGVEAAVTGETTDTITVVLPGRQVFKEELIHILEEPPITAEDLPPNVPPPGEEFFGGLQNRFAVVGINPFSLEEAGAITFDIEVVTTSGTYHATGAVHAALPWPSATGLRNVPVLTPVLLHGKTQASYNWQLLAPNGSHATLSDPTGQSPEFTPDMPGSYQVTVTDLGANNTPVNLSVVAGLWRGVVTGQDADGRPVADTDCTNCHGALTTGNVFPLWAHSGHAEIFTQNVNNPAGHYSEGCVSCHTVGYDPAVATGGIDDAPDWAAFLASGRLTHGAVDNWASILTQFPATARMANIQCENCHGPQSGAHGQQNGSRTTLSSDLCGTCHGEPLRHSRFQQWQLSSHANYELAGEEGTNATCAKCHSANGFIAWEKSGFSTANLNVTWTADQVHPITCQACHDPHDVGTTSGSSATNATVRVTGSTPELMAGFTATNVGRGAICMTCHNSRRGLKNDSTFTVADASRAPHVGAQADIIMGQNLYFAQVGTPGYHSKVEDSCVTCHMESTPPPADLSYQLGGTNHTFFASKDICSKCHPTIRTDDVQAVVEAKLVSLKAEVERAIKETMQAQIKAGKSIKMGTAATAPVIKVASDIVSVSISDSSGRQAVAVTLADGTTTPTVGLNNVKVVPPAGAVVEFYAVADPNIAKAGWNLLTVETDGSKGVHNPAFVNSALDIALFAAKNAKTGLTEKPGIGGGPGTGVGAVSCTTPYVYWAEIAARLPGSGTSKWRTDMVARNLSSTDAALHFFLHGDTGNLEGSGTIPGGGQQAFEDIVALLGGDNLKGSLEICSDMPLLVLGRMFNKANVGTFGQFVDGHVADLGLNTGETASLIGLRQKTGEYRTNISVTNGGTKSAEVAISLFDSAGTSLTAFNLTVPAGKVVQDLEPFSKRANKPNLGWGFATVTVLSGSNIRTSASVIDRITGDPVTIPAKQ